MKRTLALCLILIASFNQNLKAQFGGLEGDNEYLGELRSISTAVPMMSTSPDARAGGMGDAGVASEADGNSIYWNSAKLAFLGENTKTLSISYTPWLNELVNDINLAHVSYAGALNDNQGLAVALRYFSLGEIIFKDENNNNLGTGEPYEMALNVAYALKLSENFSIGVGLRYILSDLTNGLQDPGIQTEAGQSIAADLGLYYKSREYSMGGGQYQSYSLGLNFQNVGGKISYGTSQETADFLPTNMRLGGAYNLKIDKYNRVSFLLEFNKLLVPTPPEYDDDGNIIGGKDDNVSSFAGIFQSFSDAPAGFSEEIEEININVGAEYWYNDVFAFRGGYQFEDPEKGNRQYFTIGLGIAYNVFGLDFAYLIPASATVSSPLENTLRFTLHFNFDNG